MRSALSLKLALAGFIVPLFVYNPDMLMIDTRDIAVTAREFARAPILNIISVAVTVGRRYGIICRLLEGYFKTNLPYLATNSNGIRWLNADHSRNHNDIIGISVVPFSAH